MSRLILCLSPGECREDKLLQLYKGSYPDAREAEKFIDYLRSDFFSVSGAVLLILANDQDYISALRLEPWQDGLLLQGLETMPEYRGRGYAGSLLQQMQLRYPVRIYSHIRCGNRPSESVHRACGFAVLHDHARLLDGTVTGRYRTWLWDPELLMKDSEVLQK